MALLGSAFLAPSASPAISEAALRVAPAPAQQYAPSQSLAEEAQPGSTGATVFSAVGVAGAAVVALGAVAARGAKREQRAARTARRIFNFNVPKQEPPRPLAIPGLPVPAYRDLKDPLLAEMDAGFDPLDLATKTSPWGTGESSYYNYREAEVKHGRLAMLATVGWLTSEELQGALARKFGLPDELAPGELAPSLVNGGLGNLPAWFLPAVFMVSGWIELVPEEQNNRADVLKYKPQKGRVPGDLSFDPFALQSKLEGMGYSLKRLHNAEVKHGRAAMLAIAAFVLQEFVTKVDVLTEDELSADRVVAAVDKSIEAVDQITGATIPEVPLPF